MSTYELIKNAIINKQQVTATYDGFYREICPHILGKKNGKIHLFCYQFAGETSSPDGIVPGSPRNWRCVSIDELEDIEIQNGEWHSADNYDSQTQRCIDDIDVEVDE